MIWGSTNEHVTISVTTVERFDRGIVGVLTDGGEHAVVKKLPVETLECYQTDGGVDICLTTVTPLSILVKTDTT